MRTRHAAAVRLLSSTVLFLFTALPRPAHAQAPVTTPGALRTYATIHSLGIEWDVAGDDNHNASVEVAFRVRNDAAPPEWSPALPLVRVDYNGANMLAGSILFLQPATTYEVQLTLADPDGGTETRVVVIATRPLPAAPGARVLHVVPGSGGGAGTSADPFRGIAAAQAVARAGDRFLLHAGHYGTRVRFSVPGTASQYVMWKAAGDGEATASGIEVAASHVWLDGLTVRNQANGLVSIGAPAGVAVTRCRFFGNHYSIYLQQGGEGWYIADNTIVGDTPATTESFDGEGIELNSTAGHTVAHNSITNVADGISYPLRNVDMFGNDIFDTSDDGIEGDYGYANVRVWRNRIHNAVHNGFSFQPQYGAPWYLIRNQIVSSKEAPFKFRTTDRFVLLHNTIVNWAKLSCCNESHLLRAIGRNNLWVSVTGGQMWGFGTATADWRADLDYDGFDWGTATSPFTYGGRAYADVPTFGAASLLQTHGLRLVSKAECFESLNVPGPSPEPVPPQVLTLRSSCNAIDAGVPVPNVNDAYAGGAPDLGAFEWGEEAPVFGPRPAPPEPPSTGPTADPQSVSLAEDTSRAITLTGSDPEGQPLTFTIVTPPSRGMLSGNAPSVAYTPAPDYVGTDSFTFAVRTPSGASAVASVWVAVTEVPVGVTTKTLPHAVLHKSYGSTLQATAGMAPYAWSLASGSLPPGLTLDAGTGRIAGGPTKVGTYSFAVRVRDARGGVATQALSMKVSRK